MNVIERLESRQLRSAVLITGRVIDTIRLADGTTAHTALTDRTVYVDANDDNKLDGGDISATTDLNGNFKLRAPIGTDVIRLVELSGWEATSAGADTTTLDVSEGSTSISSGTFSTKMIHPATINVLAAYTPSAHAGLDGHQMAALIRSLFLQANQVYANSDTDVVLNVVGIVPTEYRETGSIDDDLDHLGNGDGKLAEIPALQKADRADLTVLFSSGAKTPGDDIGVGYEYDPTDTDPSENGYSVVALQNDGVDNNAFTLAHEIGHNLGAGHDKPDNDGPGVTPYAYGYHYIGENGRLYQDVMDYSDGTILPFFSTPDFSWEGEPIGNAKSADNARIIRDDAPAVAQYYLAFE